jgi:hypothetical protein
MSKRTYEDVEQERRLAKMSRDVEEIKYNTRPPTDGDGNPLTAIFGVIGLLFRPLRKLLPHDVNRVIDFASTITAFLGIIFALTDGWYGFTTVGYSILMFLVGVIGMASSPVHDNKN